MVDTYIVDKQYDESVLIREVENKLYEYGVAVVCTSWLIGSTDNLPNWEYYAKIFLLRGWQVRAHVCDSSVKQLEVKR